MISSEVMAQVMLDNPATEEALLQKCLLIYLWALYCDDADSIDVSPLSSWRVSTEDFLRSRVIPKLTELGYTAWIDNIWCECPSSRVVLHIQLGRRSK